MISFKSLILGLVVFVPMMAGVLAYQNSQNVNFPLGVFIPSLFMTLVNFNFAKKQKIRDYFVHRIKQLEWQLPSFLIVRPNRRRVAPSQDVEMNRFP